MKPTLPGKLKNSLGCKERSVLRIGKGVTKALSISRVFLVSAGILLGILLAGGPAEVSTQETNG